MLSFKNTHDAIAAEKALSASLSVVAMPTLRQVTESCGISLRIEEDSLNELTALLLAGAAGDAYTLYHVTAKDGLTAVDRLT